MLAQVELNAASKKSKRPREKKSRRATDIFAVQAEEVDEDPEALKQVVAQQKQKQANKQQTTTINPRPEGTASLFA